MEIYVFDLDIWIYLDDLSYQFGLKLVRDKTRYANYTDKSEKKFKWKKEMCCSVFQLVWRTLRLDQINFNDMKPPPDARCLEEACLFNVHCIIECLLQNSNCYEIRKL